MAPRRRADVRHRGGCVWNLDGGAGVSGGRAADDRRDRHRGPDGEGLYVDGPVGLGHRRLAIIDLSPAGHQPMATRRRPLRASPTTARSTTSRSCAPSSRRSGHAFRSRTDTEVVLHAYAEWGAGSASSGFNGMFAFAIWDRERARAVPRARPLRHQAALLRRVRRRRSCSARRSRRCSSTPRFAPASIAEALLEYFTFQNFFTDRTLFAGVRLLPAGATCSTSARRRRPAAAAALLGLSTSASPRTPRSTRSTSRSSTGCSARR